MTEAEELYETVIKNDYCIGCGVCSGITNSPFKMIYNPYGNVVAEPVDNTALQECNMKLLEICPFSGRSLNEKKLGDIVLSKNLKEDNNIGKYENCYAGYVKVGEFRKKGSSGGIIKWLGTKLLQEKKIDYLVQLSENETGIANEPLFKYKIYTEANEVIKGSKSSYYPVSLDEIIKFMKLHKGRYAVTGIPCFIKALRLLAEYDSIIKEQLLFTFGIICGGMKSANQSKMIAWQLGVHPNNLIKIDFRRKYTNRPADQKIYQVWSNSDNNEHYKDQWFGCI